jgi:hypothetical protein
MAEIVVGPMQIGFTAFTQLTRHPWLEEFFVGQRSKLCTGSIVGRNDVPSELRKL